MTSLLMKLWDCTAESSRFFSEGWFLTVDAKMSRLVKDATKLQVNNSTKLSTQITSK